MADSASPLGGRRIGRALVLSEAEMGRPLRVGLFSPFFGSTLGGGEKYLGVTAEAIRDAFPGAQVELITPVPVDVGLYEQMLNLDLSRIRFVSTNRRVTTLHRLLNSIPTLRLYRDLFVGAQTIRYTEDYDLFLAMVYVIPVFSRARRSVMLCQFPYQKGEIPHRVPRILFQIYSIPYRLLKPRLMPDDLDCFQRIICQSDYVRQWVTRYWKRDALVINPPIDVPEQDPAWGKKEQIILTVGRFFRGGHTKRHDAMIEAFRQMCQEGLTGWELHLAGSVHREGHNSGYYESIVELAKGYPIYLHPDAPYKEVQDLYDRAAIYWHAAGYQADAGTDPSLLEHFGMTTAEAMGHGAVPVAIASGGQPEVVRDGVDGFLWQDSETLKARTLELTRDPTLLRRLGTQARESAQRFSRGQFKQRMASTLAPIVEELRSGKSAHAPQSVKNQEEGH